MLRHPAALSTSITDVRRGGSGSPVAGTWPGCEHPNLIRPPADTILRYPREAVPYGNDVHQGGPDQRHLQRTRQARRARRHGRINTRPSDRRTRSKPRCAGESTYRGLLPNAAGPLPADCFGPQRAAPCPLLEWNTDHPIARQAKGPETGKAAYGVSPAWNIRRYLGRD